MNGTSIEVHPVHLGLGATVVVQPDYTGAMEWYAAYGERHAADGVEGRIVAMHTFDSPWPMWEMHPKGAEFVLCISGKMTLHQELPGGSRQSVALSAGQYAINEPGTWHTADIEGTATALFITAGMGTQHRPR
jgi:mannose-6-phosphate isomerase-like protein (cupin superfamily)